VPTPGQRRREKLAEDRAKVEAKSGAA